MPAGSRPGLTTPFRARTGSSIHVEEAGGGLPVLALPGLGGGAWFFSGLARRLQPDFRIISVDLPGTGRSAAVPPAFTADRWVADLGELVAVRIAEPVVILGHSMGTILALKAWASWPHNIRGMVFVGGLPAVRPLIRERLSQRAEAIARAGIAGWGPKASPGIFSRATLDRHPELVGLFERLFEMQDPAGYVRCCEILLGAAATLTVGSVRAPCLAITGSDDQYAPPEVVSHFMRELLGRHEEVVLPDCGHLPFLEAPDAFASAVRSFLRTLC